MTKEKAEQDIEGGCNIVDANISIPSQTQRYDVHLELMLSLEIVVVGMRLCTCVPFPLTHASKSVWPATDLQCKKIEVDTLASRRRHESPAMQILFTSAINRLLLREAESNQLN